MKALEIMIQPHFNGLAEQVSFHLSTTTNNIKAAVCWFSHTRIFEALICKLRSGVRVELLIEFDNQNIRENGLDFQSFIDMGGMLFANCNPGLMHHKFAILDDKMVLTGSFNWTYNSNAENLLVTDDQRVVTDFQQEFERQKNAAKRALTINKENIKSFSALPILEYSTVHEFDFRKRIASGCAIWIVRSDKMKIEETQIINERILPFDPYFFMVHYWTETQVFDKNLIDQVWATLVRGVSAKQSRELRMFSFQMKTGDIVLLVGKKKQLKAVGVIQSEPKRYDNEYYSSLRVIGWLKVIAKNNPVCLPRKGFLPVIGRFRSSGLAFLQEIFDKSDLL
jgi:hypothetical protein